MIIFVKSTFPDPPLSGWHLTASLWRGLVNYYFMKTVLFSSLKKLFSHMKLNSQFFFKIILEKCEIARLGLFLTLLIFGLYLVITASRYAVQYLFQG